MTTMTIPVSKPSPLDVLMILFRSLKLPAFARYAGEVAAKAEREGGPLAAIATPGGVGS